MWSKTTVLIEEYNANRDTYEKFAKSIARLVQRVLEDASLKVHSLTWRTKDPSSLRRKLQSMPGKYAGLSDVTDLAGIRVVTYFPDEVDQIAGLLRQEFAIDPKNSIDKREALDPDRFGYLSLHYVVGHASHRDSLPEYRKFVGFQAEIQLRSILQHTWAEIEHDLGYKAETAIPRAFRRRFSRLAGLLELADAEFASLRDGLRAHEATASGQLLGELSTISIDQSSLRAFISASSDLAEVNAELARLGAEISRDQDTEFLALLVDALLAVELHTLEDLRTAIVAHKGMLPRFKLCHSKGNLKGVGSYMGAPLMDLCYVLMIEHGGREALAWMLTRTRANLSITSLDDYLACYEKVRTTSV